MRTNQHFLILLLYVIAMSCNNSGNTQQELSPSSAIADTVAVFILQDTSVHKTVELPAEILPYEKADIAARVQGYIKDIKVDIGDQVRRGQTIAIIEAPELQTKYAEFQSTLQAAKAKCNSSADVLARMQKAAQAKTAGIVAPVELERTRNQFLADSASYEAAKKLTQSYKEVADYLVVQAPFSGTITARNTDRGALVGNNQTIVAIQNNQSLRLRVAVPEIYTATHSDDKEISFRVDAYPEKSFKSTLARKSGSIDATTRTELWEYTFDNTKGELKSGSFAYIKLNLERTANSFIVAPSAIVTTQEKKFVIRIRESKAEWVDVRQGMSTDKGVEIFGNLRNNDTLIIRATDERKGGSTAYWKIAH